MASNPAKKKTLELRNWEFGKEFGENWVFEFTCGEDWIKRIRVLKECGFGGRVCLEGLGWLSIFPGPIFAWCAGKSTKLWELEK